MLVLVLSLIPAVFVNTPAGYLAFLALFISGILSLIQLLVLRNKIEYRVAPGQESLRRGQEIPFSVEIKNNSILPVVHMRAEFFISGMSGEDAHVYPLLITLSPKQSRDFSLSADFPHIGVYEAGFRRMILFDLFDNFRAVNQTDEKRTIDIMPNVLEMKKLPVSTAEVSESNKATAASPLSGTDYTGVREYAYGDPIKTIQWKLSAHAGNLMTKVMETYTNTGLCIMADFHVTRKYDQDTRLTLFDGIVETAAAVGDYAYRNGLDYVLMYSGREFTSKQCTPSSFHDLGKWLEDFELSPSNPRKSAEFIASGTKGPDQQSNIILCTAELSDSAVAAIIKLKQARKNVAVYYFVPDNVYDAQRQELMAPLKRLQRAQIVCMTGQGAKEMVIRP